MKTRKEVGTSLGFIVHDFEGLLLAITSMLFFDDDNNNIPGVIKCAPVDFLFYFS